MSNSEEVQSLLESETPIKAYSEDELIIFKYIDTYEKAYLDRQINFNQYCRYFVLNDIDINSEHFKELFERVTSQNYSINQENIIILINIGEELFKYNPFALLRVDQILKIKKEFFQSYSGEPLSFKDRYDLLLKLDSEVINRIPPSFPELEEFSNSKGELYLFGIRSNLDLKFVPEDIHKDELILFYSLIFLISPISKDNMNEEIIYLTEEEVKSFFKNPYQRNDLVELAFEGKLPSYKVSFEKELKSIIEKNPPCNPEDYFTIKNLLNSRSRGVELYLKYRGSDEILTKFNVNL